MRITQSILEACGFEEVSVAGSDAIAYQLPRRHGVDIQIEIGRDGFPVLSGTITMDAIKEIAAEQGVSPEAIVAKLLGKA